MSEEIKKEKGRRLYTFFKILFCAVAFFLVIFTVLANMGGHSQFHKDTIEQFTTESTGYKAKVGTLVNMTYFPTISVDVEDLNLFHEIIDDMPAVHIDKLQAALSFWDVIRQDGHIKIMNVQGIHAGAGVLLDKTIDIKSFAIVDSGADQANLEGRGYIGATPLFFSLSMTASGQGSSRKYWFEPQRDLRIELGDIKISASMQNGMNPYLVLRDLKISRAGQDVFTGHIDISKRREREITFGGELKADEDGSLLNLDLIFDMAAKKLSGTVKSDNFKEQDFTEKSKVDELINHFVSYLGDEKKNEKILDEFFAGQDVTLDLKGGKTWQGKLKFENNTLSFK